MSTTPAADDDFNAAPVMACVPAIVVRPDGFFIPPQAGKATIAFGATPAPGGGAAVRAGRRVAMTELDPPATPAEEAAAEAMWRIWSLGGASPVPSLWKAEGHMIRDIWRTYARVALASAPAGDDDVGLLEAARDLLHAYKRLGGPVAFRLDLWACLEANLDRIPAQPERAAVGEQWVPHIGERVEVTDDTPDARDWGALPLWVAGVRAHDSGDGLDVTVSEQWPIPSRVSGRYIGQTDGFCVGASRSPDMLRPLQSPPAKVEG